jgi:hypothetical protein
MQQQRYRKIYGADKVSVLYMIPESIFLLLRLKLGQLDKPTVKGLRNIINSFDNVWEDFTSRVKIPDSNILLKPYEGRKSLYRQMNLLSLFFNLLNYEEYEKYNKTSTC